MFFKLPFAVSLSALSIYIYIYICIYLGETDKPAKITQSSSSAMSHSLFNEQCSEDD